MSPDAIRWIVVLAVLGHGIGHVLFMPALSAVMKLGVSGHSWLLTGVVGDGPVRLLATVMGGALVLAFTAAAAGIAWQTTWWRPLVMAATVTSMLLVVAMWDGLPSGPATAAIVFDAAVLVALLVLRWPAPDLIGA